jgi:hypothetical protein
MKTSLQSRMADNSCGCDSKSPVKFMGINPDHKGYCTPMTKSTCTPHRKALAKRLKPGGDLYKGKKKK